MDIKDLPQEIFKPDCQHCSRLVGFRQSLREKYPEWHNGPVPSFGNLSSRLLIVGLAPGKSGANCTGRPFTGDKAGEFLFDALEKFRFAKGQYQGHTEDGLKLSDCRITNAVKCVPPENKPKAAEVDECNKFLRSEIERMTNLRAILCLGGLSSKATIKALGLKPSKYKFGHGARYELPSGVHLFNSYHCSQQNTNTKRLTRKMFEEIFRAVQLFLRGF